jgi:hypothetical protein
MTNEDFDQLSRVGRHLSELPAIGLLSPVRKRSLRPWWRRPALGEHFVFPDATRLFRRHWDLDEPSDRRFDLLVAANVFMHSPDPPRWFRHVLAACGYFLMIDAVRRKRSEESEFGPAGDCVRYAVGDARPRVAQHFDLERLGDRLLGHHTYFGGANAFDREPLQVIALIRGDLSASTDQGGHPAAVRSALSELSQGAPAGGAG